MVVCTWEEIQEDIERQLRNQNLIPILGAGFSAGAVARNGNVPSGETLKEEMLRQIADSGVDVAAIKDIKDLKKIALYYKKMVTEEKRKKYLLSNFSNVCLPDVQKNFLSIHWPYIYTFNVDTAIEDNSLYNNVILPNRRGENEIIADLDNCLFKIHGDVKDYSYYKESICYIFDYKEYANSIEKNKYLINKIKHDLIWNNVIFVGCSLTDELDLLSVDLGDNPEVKVSRYYITTDTPDIYRKIELEQYGITHVVVVEKYEVFYREIYALELENQKIQMDELDKFRNIRKECLPNVYEKNIDYLYLGKMNYDRKANVINIPSFFVDREIVIKEIIPDMVRYHLQCICGGRVSGKSYALLSIVKNVLNRDVFYFDSRFSINNATFERLINMRNCILCFDTATLSKEQLYRIKDEILAISDRNINIVICANRSEKDILSSIKSMDDGIVQIYDLSNKFLVEEAKSINNNLSIMAIPNVTPYKSILDNLLIISEKINLEYKKTNFTLSVHDKYEMMVLILLAIQEKLTSQEIVEFNIIREISHICKKVTPIIDEDYTDIIERSSTDFSPYKVYVNSRYWLLRKLGEYASDATKHKLITDAYKEIIELLIRNHSIKYNVIEDYIKYDVINEIFFKEKHGNLALIKKLYDELNDLLADSPQFHHQKAKCYLWHSSYADNEIDEVEHALRFVNVAHYNLELSGNKNNEKVLISLAHMEFTIALIYARKCRLEKYENQEVLKKSLQAIYVALLSPYNEEYCINLIRKNERKINDLKAFLVYIQTEDLSKYNLSALEKSYVNDLIMRGYGLK